MIKISTIGSLQLLVIFALRFVSKKILLKLFESNNRVVNRNFLQHNNLLIIFHGENIFFMSFAYSNSNGGPDYIGD